MGESCQELASARADKGAHDSSCRNFARRSLRLFAQHTNGQGCHLPTHYITSFPGSRGLWCISHWRSWRKSDCRDKSGRRRARHLARSDRGQGPPHDSLRVGGTIYLRSSLKITEPYITIAGQTAPGGGITLRNVPSNKSSPLEIYAHDVVIRYLRSRPGPPLGAGDNLDSIEILGERAYNIIIDHCSFSWGVDEVASVWWDAHDITLQWSIISEGLNCSVHPKGCHSTGLLLGSAGAYNISVHHNLLAHNYARNPLIKVSGLVDTVNNVIYNPKGTPVVLSDENGRVRVNLVGNYFKRGVDTDHDKYLASVEILGGYGVEIFVLGNITPQRPSDDLDDALAIKPEDRAWSVPNWHAAPTVKTTSAQEAYEQVLDGAGATKPLRDAVDGRIVNDVRQGTGHIINDPSEVGGWPVLAAGTAPKDSDEDGMPDLVGADIWS